jgi:hypothetical protein
MILNAYAVLVGFLALFRLALALMVIGLAIAAWRRWRPAADPETRRIVEDRCYLLYLLAFLLIGSNVVSWPLFYLLLQSYVPQWPGVMCVYGVTQIGAGSLGSSRFLPGLIRALEAMKPALVFASGAWFVLYLINRQTQTAPLLRRILVLVAAVGTLAVADAGVELTYLVIPKKEDFLFGGCCTAAFDSDSRASRFLPHALVGDHYRPWLVAAFWSITLGMIFALTISALSPAARTQWGLAPLLAGALLSLALGPIFLVEIAAPALLHLPYHHCPYDLIPEVPESMVGVALYLLGSFAVGWACVARWLGACPETRTFLGDKVATLLFVGLVGYLGASVMMAVELALA